MTLFTLKGRIASIPIGSDVILPQFLNNSAMSPEQPRSLSTEEKILVALACLIALSFFLFLPKSCQMGATALNVRNFIPSNSGDSGAAALAASGDLAGIEGDSQIADAELTAALEAQAKAEEQAEAYRLELAKLTRESPHSSRAGESRNSKPSLQDASMIGAPLAATGALANQSDDELEKLTSALDARTQELTEKEQELLTHQQQLDGQNQELADKSSEIAQLQASNKEAASNLQRAQSDFQSQSQFMKDKIADLEKQLANVPDGNDPEALNSDNPEAESPENTDPAETLGEEMPANEEEESTSETPKETESSFAESEADLDEARQNLVLAIRDMEALRGSALQERYQELASSLNATSLARIKFSSGKSNLKSAEAAKIVALAQKTNPGSKFLVAGFADMSGTAAGNATLSSARAKVAANFLGEKVGYDRVSAFYLGQTARFGSKPENRVVEIWEIKASQ